MKLSIILTVYNKEQYLKRALNALLLQKEVNTEYEVLAVNDGSTDSSSAILAEYTLRDSRLRVLTQQNLGLSMARNNGLKVAKGEYVWFVDADDSVSPYSVSLLCKAMDTQPDIIPIYAITDGIDRVRNQIEQTAKTGKEVLIKGKWSHCGVFWIIRRRFLIENNLFFFPGIFHEDSEFTPRMLYLAKSVCVVPEILYTVYRDPNSITQVARPKRAFDCLIVAEHLCDFTEKMGERGTALGKCLDYNTSVIINNGFSVIVENSKDNQRLFNKEFCKKRKIIAALESAPLYKFRIEAVLFRMFPGCYVKIYKLMKLLG